MIIRNLSWAALAVTISLIAYGAPAQAQATRTWVSGVGDDANPCSRTAPCKTFAGAISKTAAAGEISVLDPGGFGTVTITKSISIVADGQEGSILAAGTSGIVINAGATDVVSIHGLMIEGSNTGTNGIRVLSAKNVYVSDTVIRGFNAAGTGRGVEINSTTNPVRVYLRNVEINNNITGISVVGTGASSNSAFIENSTIEGNSANTLVINGASASVTLFGSVLAPTPVSLLAGAQFGSTGNNRIAGGVGPTILFPLQ